MRKALVLLTLSGPLGLSVPAAACTNLIVTKGASNNGSVIVTYTVDGEFHPTLRYLPAADHAPGTLHEIKDWDGSFRLRIPEPAHTYAVTGIMNEHQVSIGECTDKAKVTPEPEPGKRIFYSAELSRVALECRITTRI